MARKDLAAARELPFVDSAELEDACFLVTLHTSSGPRPVTVILPEEYPSGEPVVLGEGLALRPGRLPAICAELHHLFAADFDSLADMEEQESDDDDAGPHMAHSEPDPELVADIASVAQQFGPFSIVTTDFTSLDALQADLQLDMSFLSRIVADAWGVARDVPLTIRLMVSRSTYLRDFHVPKVECFQVSRKCSLAAQLQNILTLFLQRLWKKEEFEHDAELVDASHRRPVSAPRQAKKSRTSNKDLKKLTEMGFDVHRAQDALAKTSTVEEALTVLVAEEAEEGFSRSGSGRDPLAPTPEATHKAIPPRTHGFLVQVMQYALQRIPSCSSYCVICDKMHMFASGAMLKPAVCSRTLCAFSFKELKVGTDAAEDIATEAGVVDLLVCLAKAAAESPRAESIMEPYPQVLHPDNPRKFALDPRAKDLLRLRQVFACFPSVQHLAHADDPVDLKSRLDRREPLAYPLLQWIISSNRSHIVKLQPHMFLRSIKTRHQYLLVTSTPEKQESFSKMKKKHGTEFAFHGSPIENWHCILREGLKNATGTKLQLNGAAHGAGIYLSPTAQLSLDYATRMVQNSKVVRRAVKGKPDAKDTDITQEAVSERFINDSQMFCLALCEVIKSEHTRKNGSIWVCSNAENVLTRFFFVFDDPGAMTSSSLANTESQAFLEEILQAMQMNGI